MLPLKHSTLSRSQRLFLFVRDWAPARPELLMIQQSGSAMQTLTFDNISSIAALTPSVVVARTMTVAAGTAHHPGQFIWISPDNCYMGLEDIFDLEPNPLGRFCFAFYDPARHACVNICRQTCCGRFGDVVVLLGVSPQNKIRVLIQFFLNLFFRLFSITCLIISSALASIPPASKTALTNTKSGPKVSDV
jgi:hypothetical protein